MFKNVHNSKQEKKCSLTVKWINLISWLPLERKRRECELQGAFKELLKLLINKVTAVYDLPSTIPLHVYCSGVFNSITFLSQVF